MSSDGSVSVKPLSGTDAWVVVRAIAPAHHEEPQIAQHLLAGVPHGTYVECFADPDRDPMWQALWANRPAVKNGYLEVSKDPGFGIALERRLVEKYRVA